MFFELMPLFFLWRSRKAWQFWLLIAGSIHLMNTLLLNLPFLAHFVVYLAFIDYTGLFPNIEKFSWKRIFQIAFFLPLFLLQLDTTF